MVRQEEGASVGRPREDRALGPREEAGDELRVGHRCDRAVSFLTGLLELTCFIIIWPRCHGYLLCDRSAQGRRRNASELYRNDDGL